MCATTNYRTKEGQTKGVTTLNIHTIAASVPNSCALHTMPGLGQHGRVGHSCTALGTLSGTYHCGFLAQTPSAKCHFSAWFAFHAICAHWIDETLSLQTEHMKNSTQATGQCPQDMTEERCKMVNKSRVTLVYTTTLIRLKTSRSQCCPVINENPIRVL